MIRGAFRRLDVVRLGIIAVALFSPRVSTAQPSPAPAPPPSDPGAADEATRPETKPAPSAQPAEAPPASPETSPIAPPAGEPPPADQSGPPPHYYVEPATPPQGEPSAPPIYEPPPPLPARHESPSTAFWTGARLGWFVPFGTLWFDGFPVGGFCCDYRRRTWSDYASSGPLFEIDAGARISRYYNVFALWEHATLGSGGLDDESFGGQNRGDTDLFGAGVRFSTNPDGVGFLIELALGYRRFGANWEDGTELDLTDGLFDARIGLGADIRLSGLFSLSPLLTLGSGVFTDAQWSNGDRSASARGPLDENGQYGTLTFEMGAHFDIY